jgi:hypothetical protein
LYGGRHELLTAYGLPPLTPHLRIAYLAHTAWIDPNTYKIALSEEEPSLDIGWFDPATDAAQHFVIEEYEGMSKGSLPKSVSLVFHLFDYPFSFISALAIRTWRKSNHIGIVPLGYTLLSPHTRRLYRPARTSDTRLAAYRPTLELTGRGHHWTQLAHRSERAIGIRTS